MRNESAMITECWIPQRNHIGILLLQIAILFAFDIPTYSSIKKNVFHYSCFKSDSV